jgi:hypothetical protein
MSRVRDLSRHTAWFQALALLLLSGCIFSPQEKVIPPPEAPKITKPEDVVRSLSFAYQFRNYNLFASLLANDPDRNAAYIFQLSEPTQSGENEWGYTEEVRIHRRMFKPEETPPGETPVPPELWLSGVTITLTQLGPFQERTDLYSANHGADGKPDPDIWKIEDSHYSTDVFFDTQGENSVDFQVTGEANFVVITDKTKQVGDPGKFLLYIWEDLLTTPKPQASQPS